MERFIRTTQNPWERDNLTGELVSEIRLVRDRLRLSVGAIPDRSLKAYVNIDPPRASTEGGQIARAYLISSDNRIKRFRDDYAESKGWADAYLLTRDIGYVFAPREIAVCVYLAMEKIVREKYGIRLPESMLDYSKQDKTRIAAAKEKAYERGYYRRSPFDLRPVPHRLTRADVASRVDGIVANLSGYQGLTSPGESVNNSVNAAKVIDWLKQFSQDANIESALGLLEQIRLIGRSEINEALRIFVERRSGFRNAVICPFGAEKDSGVIAGYFANDTIQRLGLRLMGLRDALVRESPRRPIIVVDDFIGSGGQAVTILESWFGRRPSSNLGEERDITLSEGERAALRNRILGFVLAAGWTDGVRKLRALSNTLDLRTEMYAHIADGHLPNAFSGGVFGPSGRRRDFQEECARIGRGVLTDKAESHGRDWAKERALGYGNRGLLIVFPYNVPTQTLTCLWKSGEVRGTPWFPLLRRREKI